MARSRQTKAASIKDVAALAQVSVPTVSRYLNDRERVSAEKREKIAKAIDMLGYRPNPIARALVKDQTKQLLFCLQTPLCMVNRIALRESKRKRD
mgnify:CR=1 FL=1